MTTQRNAMVDAIYARLVNAPNELDPTIGEVLVALGMMASAVLVEGFTDLAARQRKTDWFLANLLRSVRAKSEAELTLN